MCFHGYIIHRWILDGFTDVARLVLLCVMYLWCPNEDTQRFAFSSQLEGENGSLECVERADVMSADEKDDVDVIGARG